mmetsp:Transcript_70119/g.157016  ORF Transcript_70119/g.157016 Transcript_70119/m.157016 type:complete len:210 (-) Transcript_70119:67-696(-)
MIHVSPTMRMTKVPSNTNQLSRRQSRLTRYAAHRMTSSTKKRTPKVCSATWKPTSASQIVACWLELASMPSQTELRITSNIVMAANQELLAIFAQQPDSWYRSTSLSSRRSRFFRLLACICWYCKNFIRRGRPVSRAIHSPFRPRRQRCQQESWPRRRMLRTLFVTGSCWIMSTKNNSMGVLFILPALSRQCVSPRWYAASMRAQVLSS